MSGSGRPGRRPAAVSDANGGFAAELTGRSGTAPVIEAALAHATGRPRPLQAHVRCLTSLLCLVLDDRPLFLTEATRLLFCELSKASRGLLGVPGIVATGRSWPPTGVSATASARSARSWTPRRCRRTAA